MTFRIESICVFGFPIFFKQKPSSSLAITIFQKKKPDFETVMAAMPRWRAVPMPRIDRHDSRFWGESSLRLVSAVCVRFELCRCVGDYDNKHGLLERELFIYRRW